MKYDLIIVGGGTAGSACAYTAGKLGLKVLIIEKNSYLGGTMTSGLVTPAMNSGTNIKINNSFFEILMTKLNKMGGQITYKDGNTGWFNPELMKIALDKLMEEAGVDVLFNTEINEIIRNKEKILGVTLNINSKYIETIYSDNKSFNNKMLLKYIETRYLVDGTGDAKIFEKINLEFLNNFENKKENKYQPANLRFIMSGIDLKQFSSWIMELDPNRDVTTAYTIDDEIHLSTAYTWDKNGVCKALGPIFNKGIDEGLLKDTDINYFQVFTIPGMHSSLAFNCPRILDEFNSEDKKALSKALKQGRECIYRISKFMIKEFAGFKKAYISSIANSLGVRVSNRIKGKYVYTIDDLRLGKKFENPVLISKYPVDVHSDKDTDSILEKQEKEYMLPVESLMSDKYENLFAIGRCISADFLSQGALRIIPSCFAMGEGLAKYIANIS